MPTTAGTKSKPASSWGQTDFTSNHLRQALGAYPTGVAIVTTCTEDGRHVGLTINSFASLSLDPPMVLWSLVNHSGNHNVFRDCKYFCINVLEESHTEMALRFASPKTPDKFADTPIRVAAEGVCAIEGALTTLVCENEQNQTVGDHLLMIGRVVRTDHKAGHPLVFHGGRFGEIGRADEVLPTADEYIGLSW